MNQLSLGQALDVLRRQVGEHGTSFSGALLREIGALSIGLFSSLSQTARATQDPRVALEYAALVEEQYRACLRAQLAAVAALEGTGAHTLSLAEYDRLRAGNSQFNRPVEYASGRTMYKDTSAVVESWVGINHFEAEARVEDTHRLVARRTLAGTAAAPRYPGLAELYADPARDPRPSRDAARRIEALEPDAPAAETELGVLPGTAARAPDGRLLEEHAVRILSGDDPVTAEKRFSGLCAEYKKANTEAAKPEIGIFRRKSILGVDQYLIRVEGVNAEVMRSVFTQADNPRTKAGAAARTLTDLDVATTPGSQEQGGPASNAHALPATDHMDASVDPDSDPDRDRDPGGNDPCPAPIPDEASEALEDSSVGPWLQTSDPPPDWAIEPEERAVDAQPEAPVPSPDIEAATVPTGSTCPAGTDLASAGGAVVPEADVPVPRRRLQAIMGLIKARVAGTGNNAVIRPQVHVFMHLEHLLDLAKAQGITAHGVELDAGELRRTLCDADILPHVLGGQSQVLDSGRSRRTFTRPQRLVLLGRDRGCIVPGCTYPPDLCEAHHWPDGGWVGGCGTSVEEGTLLCPNEHDNYHAGKFKIIDVNGLPHVLLPKHVDPAQIPRRNQYWYGTHEDPTRPGFLRSPSMPRPPGRESPQAAP